MAITGPDTSAMACDGRLAGRHARAAMWRSTFSTTTIASSTTMPMASTRPNSDRLFSENPSSAMNANVPISETGTATSGMIVARQFWRKTSTTRKTSANGFEQGVHDAGDRLLDELGRVVDDA